ncbi:hypothetical protein J4Q44_G00348070 [Coregonus suidteri]|uniref:Uncharacterized protein n=1 Tax=Coregonus suidteri TaxID=861788 RepID=A0AAN8QLG9_9TELE
MFYSCTIESILTGCITAWYGNCSASDRKALQRGNWTPSLYKKCQGDAARLCHTNGWNETSELMPPGAVFLCLYRHAYRTEEQGRRLSRDCVRWRYRGAPPPEGNIHIEALLIRACQPVIQSHCHDVADNQVDTGDLMECVWVQNKHQKEMNNKCTLGVTHFQLIQMKDFRFSYKSRWRVKRMC